MDIADKAALRAKIKECLNALDSTRPIVFGSKPLITRGEDASLYIAGLHGGGKDLVRVLADRIDYDEGGGTYLFSGNRGTGKTTELMRLAQMLQDEGCEVFYVDMAEYLNLTVSVEITDFLISVLGGLSEKIEERFNGTPGWRGFFERVWNFLQSEVKVEEFKFTAGDYASFKMSLQQDPTFKKKLQEGTRGHVARLVKEAREFVLEAVNWVRGRTDENKKVVLLVDSVERLRGVGDSKDVAEVFKSAETVFSGHSDKLRFPPLHLVYTIPPYLSALAGSLAFLYSGGRIYMLPSAHIYLCCPQDGAEPSQSEDGLNAMVEIVAKRFPQWNDFFTREKLVRLARNSGGDLRDYFRMVGLCIAESPYQEQLPLPDSVIKSAEDAVRNDMPLARDDKEWLGRIQKSHQRELDSLDKLPDFARLVEGKYILNYRNGEDWYDVHPLLRSVVKEPSGGSGESGRS